MRVGLAAIGIGPGAQPAVLRAIATSAEATGFASLWAGEHVILVDRQTSRYPYAEDGQLAVPSGADWLDPLIALSIAAAVTQTIRVATGVLLLPEHNPLLVAKQAASLDRLSGGRVALGVGIGWSAEEFAALGVPFARRSARTAEYVAAMRRLWADDVATYSGEFVSFDAVRCYPKPDAGQIPILLGGNSDAALARVARWGDGWYGFNLSPTETAERIQVLRRLCAEHGRDPSELEIVIAPFTKPTEPKDLPALAALGVREVVVVAEPPPAPQLVAEWTAEVGRRWIGAAGP
jgi:probable F420-dependent oxidoreductase